MTTCGRAALLVASAVIGVGCASADGAAGADALDAQPTAPRCVLGHIEGGVFVETPAGGDVELTRGFQGYLLVVAALRIEGASPRKTLVKLHANKDGDPPHDSARPGLQWEAAGGGAISESFEIWLSPPLVTAFVGRTGSIALEVSEAGAQLCALEQAVRFVDDQVCMHYEDGSLDCTGEKKGGGAAP